MGVLWDGYNVYKGYEKSTSSSELGDELRKLADYFENQMRFNPADD